MTYIRKQEVKGNTYVYSVRSYRDHGKVRQEATYLGREVEKNGEKILQPKIDRSSVRRVLDSAAYMMYRIAEEEGFIDRYDEAIQAFTKISNAAKKIVMLACECLAGSEHSIYLHTGIPELSDKEIRDLVDLAGRKDPDMIALMERSMAPSLIEQYGSSGIVYDLSAIRYFGDHNDLADFGHYYRKNGELREINFVLCVTRDAGIPIHHRPLAGNIPSVSAIHNLTGELKDYGILTALIVVDRGFYSSDNMKDLHDYSWIGAIPSSLKIYDDLIHDSRGIDNSRNYIQYRGETVFYREVRIHGTRYLVYFSPRLRSRRIESFFARLAERETALKELGNTRFKTEQDLIGSVESTLKGIRKLFDVIYHKESLSFSYSLKHKAIQRRNNRLGYTILITNTLFPAPDILKIYRQKDVVEKAFSHVKPHLEPFFARTEEGTRARLFLTILGYTFAAIIAGRCDITYENAMKTMAGIREVVYSNGSHAHVEYTKDQRELLEKLKIEL